jgi:twitching motility protein PilI
MEEQAWMRGSPLPVEALSRFTGVPAAALPQAAAPERALERWALPLKEFRVLVDPAVGCELIDWAALYPLPNSPPWVLGVINLRGTLVPVFDLRRLFPGSSDGNPRPKLLFVIGQGEQAGGIVIEGLPYRQRIDGAQGATPPEGMLPAPLARHTVTAYCSAEVWWLDCDLPGLLRSLGSRTGLQ